VVATTKTKNGGARSDAGLDGLDLGAVIHAAVSEGARRFLEGFDEGAAAAAPKKARPKRRPAAQ